MYTVNLYVYFLKNTQNKNSLLQAEEARLDSTANPVF